jgi:hypothetical protein
MSKPKPQPPKPELVYVPEDGPQAPLFTVWSSPLECYLAVNGVGWTTSLLGAGTFTEERALELANDTFTVRPLADELKAALGGANPVVLQAIAAMGGR